MCRGDTANHEAYTVEFHCHSKLHLRDRDTVCLAILFSFFPIYATSTGSIHTRARTHTPLSQAPEQGFPGARDPA